MVRLSFRGLMAAVFVPFNKDGSLRLDVIPSYARLLKERGVEGVWVNGTAGEGLSLTLAERKAVAGAWLSCREDVPTVIIQCGGISLKDAQDLARHAEAGGAAGVAVLPDLFNKPLNTDELVDYVGEVASACPNTPLLYYHIPMKTGLELPMSDFLEKGVHRVPSLSGIKFTDDDVATEGRRCLKVDSSLTIFNGFDEKLQEAFSVGFTSAVTAGINLFPDLSSRVISLTEAGNEEQAKKVQQMILQCLKVVFRQTGGFSVSSMKSAASLLTGLDLGPTRLPVRPFTDQMVLDLGADLKSLGFKVHC